MLDERDALGDMPTDSLAHRKVDALVERTGRFRIEIVNIVDPEATAAGPEIDGIPIAVDNFRMAVRVQHG